jgi:hypothetical protein
MAKAEKETTIDILKLEEGRLDFCVLGTTPIILNRMSEKARRELLLPRGRKTAADKAASLKHDPLAEFRTSPYTDPSDRGPTLLQFLSTAFKGAMMTAALDMPGVNKSQIQRLVWVNEERIALYGVPKLLMSVTRSADMNKTPDIRTRAIVPEWACRLSVSFRKPILREQGIANLLAAAGVTPGVGDWRVGKGSGIYGQFELVDSDDERFTRIVENGGRAAQVAAMEAAEPYDLETEELLAWFTDEKQRRGFTSEAASPLLNGKRSRKNGAAAVTA